MIIKVFVKNDEILTHSKDLNEELSGCESFYIDQSARIHSDLGLVKFSSLGVTQKESDENEARGRLAQSDTDMARAAEDLISILVGKNVIDANDLPEALRNKMAVRQAYRDKLAKSTK